MTILITSEGKKLAAERFTGRKENGYTNTSGRLRLRLFSNNYTPITGSLFANFTEATFSGYASVAVAKTDWSAAVLNGSNQAQSSFAPKAFSHNGGGTTGTVYGLYLTTDPTLGSDLVLAAEKFSSSVTFTTSGDTQSYGVQLSTTTLGSGLTLMNEGKTTLLNRLIGRVDNQNTLKLRLFKNDVTLAASLVLADFTTCNFSGYADQNLVYSDWAAAVLNSASRGQCDQGTYSTFTHNGGATNNTGYGYVVHDTDLGYALWAEKFASAKTITAESPSAYVQGRFECGV